MDGAPHENWSIKQLAQVSAISEAHFSREFKKAFGIPPHRYLLTRRIERATALLRDSDLPITEIALQTGWNSVGTFGRIFSDITGESPGAFRARESSIPHARKELPECFMRAVDRPNLNTAVSEKRRLKPADKIRIQSN